MPIKRHNRIPSSVFHKKSENDIIKELHEAGIGNLKDLKEIKDSRIESRILSPKILPKDSSLGNSLPSTEEYIVKGFGDNNGDLVINMAQIRELLFNLKQVKDSNIKDLSGEQLKKFHRLVSIISVAYRSAAYASILKIIEEVFSSSLEQGTVKPGTVEAYFVGCHLQTNFSNPACSAICSGSVPLDPSVTNWQQCQNLTLLYDEKEHLFTVLNQMSNDKRENAYIFISPNAQLSGFNEDEISKLKEYGVSKVKIVRYKDNGVDYKEETPDFMNLDSLKENLNLQPDDSNGDPPSTGQGNAGLDISLLIIFTLIVIALITLVVWGIYSI